MYERGMAVQARYRNFHLGYDSDQALDSSTGTD